MKKKFAAFLDSLIKKNAMIGVFIGMFLESSFVPIPSEAVLLAFGTTVPVRVVTIAGTLGSTCGGMLGYYIGKTGGDALVRTIGPYIDVDARKVDRVQRLLNHSMKVSEGLKQRFPWAPGWVFEKIFSLGGLLVLGSRIVPFIPFKVFSISSGLVHIDIFTFVFYTMLGSIPRCFILATIGKKLEPYKKPVLLSILGLVVFYLAYIFALRPMLGH